VDLEQNTFPWNCIELWIRSRPLRQDSNQRHQNNGTPFGYLQKYFFFGTVPNSGRRPSQVLYLIAWNIIRVSAKIKALLHGTVPNSGLGTISSGRVDRRLRFVIPVTDTWRVKRCIIIVVITSSVNLVLEDQTPLTQDLDQCYRDHGTSFGYLQK